MVIGPARLAACAAAVDDRADARRRAAAGDAGDRVIAQRLAVEVQRGGVGDGRVPGGRAERGGLVSWTVPAVDRWCRRCSRCCRRGRAGRPRDGGNAAEGQAGRAADRAIEDDVADGGRRPRRESRLRRTSSGRSGPEWRTRRWSGSRWLFSSLLKMIDPEVGKERLSPKVRGPRSRRCSRRRRRSRSS